MNKYISIVLATYNAIRYLEEALLSIKQQTYNNYELIIIDGGSIDGSTELITKYENIISAYISEPDRGIYDAWNKGVNLASCNWIGFMGADDILELDAIENYHKFIENNKLCDYDLINSKIEIIDDNLKSIKTVGEPYEWKKFSRSMMTSHVMMLHNKSLFAKHGKYNLDYKIAADSEFLLRAGKELKTAFMNKKTVTVRYGGCSVSFKALSEAKRIKIEIAKRNILTVYLEYIISILLLTKYKIKKKILS